MCTYLFHCNVMRHMIDKGRLANRGHNVMFAIDNWCGGKLIRSVNWVNAQQCIWPFIFG